MKSRKQIWIAALCLLSATVITISLRARSRGVLAAQHSVTRASVAPPAVYLPNASMKAAAIANAMLLDDDLGPATLMQNRNSYLPTVEEFTLTPPNPSQNIYKTMLSVRFPESAAERLPSQLPMMLGVQHVVLQRSADVPGLFSTLVDFNWTLFIKQQQHRKELASKGKTVPVYKGRDFIRREKVQFIDPADIQRALQSHQPIQFSPQILLGGDVITIIPDHELMMNNIAVVEDGSIEQQQGFGLSGRTYDACITASPGNPNGAWTFQTLWMAALNTTSVITAEQALANFLANWQSSQTINGFAVAERPGMGTLGSQGLLANWAIDSTNGNQCNGPCPSLLAPVRLNAIVNRIDLGGQDGQTPAGELRFVFGVSAGTQAGQQCLSPPQSAPPLFNIIFEYKVPTSWTASAWASQWNNLPDNWDFQNCPAGGCYIPLLQSTITDNVVGANCQIPGGSMNTCLSHIRTNEIELDPGQGLNTIWEQREFAIREYGSPNTLAETTMFQTPDDSFNFGGAPCGGPGLPACTSQPNTFADYIIEYESTIDLNQGTQPFVTNQYPTGQSFQAGSSLNGFNGLVAGTYWNGCVYNGTTCTVAMPTSLPGMEARRYFSLNTCNGCHGVETSTLGFQQVFNRVPGSSSNLSTFLLGCVPSTGSCATSGNPGPDTCAPNNEGINPGQECELNTPGQELVPDPANSSNGSHAYGDIAFRETNLQTILSPANDLFLPFIRPRIGSGH